MNKEINDLGKKIISGDVQWEVLRLPAEDFPKSVREMPDPPDTLYYVGNKTLITESENVRLCVVGSRRYSDYGYRACNMLIEGLKGFPVTIVSGLALGIDGVAHEAALKHKIPTISVPGSGLDPTIIYPRSHLYLAERIINEGGLLLSEYEPSTRASPWSFPMRNRIMAGLCQAVLIIEGEKDSGTLITARLAVEYNRDVFTVPGSIFSETSEGPHGLIKRGATPICSVEDLIEALGFNGNKKIDFGDGKEVVSEENKSKATQRKYSECSTEEIQLALLIGESTTKEELYSKSGLPVSQVHILLSMLEIRGLIREEFGKISLCQLPPVADQ